LSILRNDLPAGVAVAGLLVPEAVAYAAIAGLPATHALVAAVVGLAIYAVFGRSRFAIVSPTSSSAAVLAAALGSLGIVGAERTEFAIVLVAGAGVLFLVAGLVRLGFVASFVSRPVLRGFAFGLALSIVIKQLPEIVGVDARGSNVLLLLVHLLEDVAAWHWAGVGLAAAALALLILMRRVSWLPGGFVVLTAAIGLSYLIDLPLHHVSLVGPLKFDLSRQFIPRLDRHQAIAVISAAAPLALILFVEAWGTMRTLGFRHGEALTPDRELVAIGAANLAAGLVGGMPVGAGFSASSAGEAAGAASRLTGVVAAVTVTALSLIGGNLIARIPEPVLAAVVVSALLHALSPQPIVRLWQLQRDQLVASLAVVAVLVLGVLNGMLVAVALSVVAIMHRLSMPSVAVLGRLNGSDNYVDIARHPEAMVYPEILIVRPGEPLFFANAERVFADLEKRAGGGIQMVIVSLEASGDLDSSAVDGLGESATRIAARGQSLLLAHVKDPVRDLLIAAGGVVALLGERGTRTVAEAVIAARHSLQETSNKKRVN
jgi:MFS superfamily sulfate permease-like transporter